MIPYKQLSLKGFFANCEEKFENNKPALDLQLLFVHLVDLTEPICQEINSAKASMTIYDTSGIETFVKDMLLVLRDFFTRHPLINPETFLGDSAFDIIEIYSGLLHDLKFGSAFISLQNKLALPDSDCPLNEHGIPCSSRDPSLPMKRETSKSHLRCSFPTMKFVCPKKKSGKKDGKYKHKCSCDNPCAKSSCSRMFYVYPDKNLRAYSSALRNSED